MSDPPPRMESSSASPSPEASPSLKGGRGTLKHSVSMPVMDGVFELGVDISDDPNSTVTQKRQRRLERNRESARLSRRRRKQYLEVLEDKVSALSEEMDVGRRAHVKSAVSQIVKLRKEAIASEIPAAVPEMTALMHKLDEALSTNCAELRVALQFHKQQLTSLVLPNEMRFVLWLTLQNPVFFLAGRSDQQRLSAARIGEKMLLRGITSAAPDSGMWALVCNDIGVSYDQEEKIRAYQRSVLNDKRTWVDRHSIGTIGRTIQRTYEALKGAGKLMEDGKEAERNVLSMEQRLKLMKYCSDNKERLKKVFGKSPEQKNKDLNELLASVHNLAHDSMKLSAVDNILMNLNLPQVNDVVSGGDTKKLSRRPSYESLASASQLEKRNSSNDLKVLGAGTNDLTDQCDFATPPNDALFSNANPASITPEAAQNAFVGHLVESGSTGPQGGGIVQVPGVGPVRVNSQQDLLAAGQQQQQKQQQQQHHVQHHHVQHQQHFQQQHYSQQEQQFYAQAQHLQKQQQLLEQQQQQLQQQQMQFQQEQMMRQQQGFPQGVEQGGRLKTDSLDVLDMVLNDIDIMNSLPDVAVPPQDVVPPTIDDPLLPAVLVAPPVTVGNSSMGPNRLATGSEDLDLFDLTENDWEIGGGMESPEHQGFWAGR
ncbi:hypothetical protein TrST_g14376 [Triparma strigata]|uniref:BZIP domain-containing protein n=1 Tax=Triparma strigata TaxID=1606541 RepID=A0A9W7B460_9STRA|nr:hypothetical protein TrST_g14376 [Triparma strigata]